MIVGMQSGDSERQTRLAIGHDGEASYKKGREEEKPDQRVTIEAIIEATVSGIIARCAPTGRVDIGTDMSSSRVRARTRGGISRTLSSSSRSDLQQRKRAADRRDVRDHALKS